MSDEGAVQLPPPADSPELMELGSSILAHAALLRLPESDDLFDDDFAVRCAWGAHGYATGMTPFYSAYQLQQAMRRAFALGAGGGIIEEKNRP